MEGPHPAVLLPHPVRGAAQSGGGGRPDESGAFRDVRICLRRSSLWDVVAPVWACGVLCGCQVAVLAWGTPSGCWGPC